MKLISCYIENFGGLSRYSLDFDAGLTVIQEPNGFGKTTLAEFIRAMFYGFPRKTKTLGKRQKYRPWNGKKCCGHLTFEHEGKQYRMERTFGSTPRGDSFSLIDLQTGQKSSRFSEEIGLELFGLDADSFERSTYLPQNRDNGPLTTDSIQAKLSGLVEDERDVGNFEKALAALRTKRSAYIPYRGSGGAAAEAGAQITRVQQALDRAEKCGLELTDTIKTIAALEADLARTDSDLDQVRQALKAANEAAARRAHRQRLEEMEADHCRCREELDALGQKYPRGIPDREGLASLNGAVERKARLDCAQPVTDADRAAQRFLDENQGRFADGIPTEEDLDAMRQICDDCRVAATQLEGCALSREDEAELTGLRAFFAPGIPQEDTLRQHEADLEQAARLRQENQRLAARTVVEEPRYKVPSPLTVPLLLGCGILGAVAGIILMARSMFAPGGVALGLGVLFLLGAGYLSLRAGMTRQVPGLNPQIQELIRENEARAAELEAPVRSFLAQYGNSDPRLIRERIARLEALTQREGRLARQRLELTARQEAYNQNLREFFQCYGLTDADGSGHELLARLQRGADTWLRAQKQLEERDQRLEAHRRELAEVTRILEAVREQYGLSPRNREQVLAIRDDARRMAELTQAVQRQSAALEAYRQTHTDALTVPANESSEDPSRLARREQQLLQARDHCSRELLRSRQRESLLRGEADRIPELRDELAVWQNEKTAYQERAAVLDDTIDFLSRARENLALAYMGPIRESFTTLLQRMNGEEAERILVTPALEVRLERGGESRVLDYFSAGQTDLVQLCMRLALVDALFREAKPFIILDDPFVNLDDAHTAQALALLRELSRDRQILYLVCNSSRI